MKPITVRSDWGYFDALDGKDLRDGESLRIEWPDNSVSVATVHLETKLIDPREHVNDVRAYLNDVVRGLPVRVYLRGAITLRAERTGVQPEGIGPTVTGYNLGRLVPR